jgi:polyisoprenoid-binding protein YceI
VALFAGLGFLPAGLSAAAAAPVSLTATAVSVQIQGDSTLHHWTANAGSATVTASLLTSDKGLLVAVQNQAFKSLDLVVAVDSLKSSEGGGMDKNMHQDLDSDKFPSIRFSMKSYSLADLTVTALGSLSIHGQSKDVSLTGQLVASNSALELKGSYPLLMSDYGIKPPVMMFGTVRVADKVAIVWDFKLLQ